MKLEGHHVRFLRDHVSPGPKAGGGLKRSAQVIHDYSAIVSPGPKAGGGLKLEGGS